MSDAFQWVPFYEELADKLLTYNDRRRELFELVKKVSAGHALMQYLHFDREDWWAPRQHQIDPFSVFGIMNRGQTSDANRTVLATILADAFEMRLPVPRQFLGIPVLDARKSFFAGVDDVWNLFCSAISAAKSNNFGDAFTASFERAIDAKGNGLASITMGLYWIRPNVFMPLDGNSRAFIAEHYDIHIQNSRCSGAEYVALLHTLRTKIDAQTPGLTFPEMSYSAWTQKDTSSVDEKQQRAAFKKWYGINVGTVNSANTISSALGKARLKSGQAIFSVTDFATLDAAIKNNGLEGYFQSSGGDYAKMDAVFDIDKTAQRDDLKSGIKHYLNFLESQAKTTGQQRNYFPITPEEARIIDVDPTNNALIDSLQQRLQNWAYGVNVQFANIYNVYESETPHFTSEKQRVEYLQLLR